MDSIVDSFFPFLDDIEKEVVAIDNLVFAGTPGHSTSTESETIIESTTERKTRSYEAIRKISNPQGVESFEMKERSNSGVFDSTTLITVPGFSIGFDFRRLRLAFARRPQGSSSSPQPRPSTTYITIRRMARTRRLVTSLVRLLATKSEVVSQIQKRLLISNHAGLGNRTSKHDDVEVAIYMGDVQGM